MGPVIGGRGLDFKAVLHGSIIYMLDVLANPTPKRGHPRDGPSAHCVMNVAREGEDVCMII